MTMLIDLKSIPIGGIYLRGESPPEIIDIPDPGVEFHLPIQYDLKVSFAGNMFLVRGSLKAEVRLVCSRCLTKFKKIIEVEDFFLRKEIDDLGETIDLTDEVRADIILTLPIKPLCKTECLGICPACGQDLNEEKCGCSAARSDSPFAGLSID